MTWIAEFPLTWILADGRRIQGFIAIGEPTLVPDGDDLAICPVALHGLDGVTRVRGVGKFHALLQGLHFIEKRIRDEVDDGLRVAFPDDAPDDPMPATERLLGMFRPFGLSRPDSDPCPPAE